MSAPKPWENGGTAATGRPSRPLTNVVGGNSSTALTAAGTTGYNRTAGPVMSTAYGGGYGASRGVGRYGGLNSGTSYGGYGGYGGYGSSYGSSYGGYGSSYGSGYGGYGSSYGSGYGGLGGYGMGGYGNRGALGRRGRFGGGYGYDRTMSYGDRSNLQPKLLESGLDATRNWMDRMVDVLDTFGLISATIEDNCFALQTSLGSISYLSEHLSQALGLDLGVVLMKLLAPLLVVYRYARQFGLAAVLDPLHREPSSFAGEFSVQQRPSRSRWIGRALLGVGGFYTCLKLIHWLHAWSMRQRSRLDEPQQQQTLEGPAAFENAFGRAGQPRPGAFPGAPGGYQMYG